MELEQIFDNENVICTIKSARLRWLGHVTSMNEDKVAKEVLVSKVKGTMPRCRPRKRWFDCMESDPKLGVRNWKFVAENPQKWRQEVVELAKTRLGYG